MSVVERSTLDEGIELLTLNRPDRQIGRAHV